MKALFAGLIGNPLSLLIAAGIIFAAGCGYGWTANGWRLGAQIADVKAERANETATQNKEVLDDFVETAKKIKEQADGANADFAVLGTELAQIRKEFKNAKAKPLPVDCRPDDVRMRSLTRSVDTVRKAVARQQSGGAVPDPGGS